MNISCRLCADAAAQALEQPTLQYIYEGPVTLMAPRKNGDTSQASGQQTHLFLFNECLVTANEAPDGRFDVRQVHRGNTLSVSELPTESSLIRIGLANNRNVVIVLKSNKSKLVWLEKFRAAGVAVTHVSA